MATIGNRHPARNAVCNIATYQDSLAAGLNAIDDALRDNGLRLGDIPRIESSSEGMLRIELHPCDDTGIRCDCCELVKPEPINNVVCVSYCALRLSVEIVAYIS